MKFLIVKSISIQWHYNVYYALQRNKNDPQNDINYGIFSKYGIKAQISSFCHYVCILVYHIAFLIPKSWVIGMMQTKDYRPIDATDWGWKQTILEYGLIELSWVPSHD